MTEIEHADAIGHIDQAINHLSRLRDLLRRHDAVAVRGERIPVLDLLMPDPGRVFSILAAAPVIGATCGGNSNHPEVACA